MSSLLSEIISGIIGYRLLIYGFRMLRVRRPKHYRERIASFLYDSSFEEAFGLKREEAEALALRLGPRIGALQDQVCVRFEIGGFSEA